MGMIAKVLSSTPITKDNIKATETKVDKGGGYNRTGLQYSAPGDDSQPLPDDSSALIETQQTGGVAAVGYLDPKNDQKAQVGEKRIYARQADGTSICEIWLQADGTIAISNDNGSISLTPAGEIEAANGSGNIRLESGGDVDINGVTIDTSGNITTTGTVDAGTVEATTSLKVATKELNGHIHGGVTVGAGVTSPF